MKVLKNKFAAFFDVMGYFVLVHSDANSKGAPSICVSMYLPNFGRVDAHHAFADTAAGYEQRDITMAEVMKGGWKGQQVAETVYPAARELDPSLPPLEKTLPPERA